jgi:hypothetical protein
MPARLLGGASRLDLRSAAGALAVVRRLLVRAGPQALRFDRRTAEDIERRVAAGAACRGEGGRPEAAAP